MDKNTKKQQNDKKNDIEDNICKYVKLSTGPRNFLSYFFIDRYSIIYMSNKIYNNCYSTRFKYNVLETSTEVCEYYFNSFKITKKNEDLIDNYTDLLRKFVANKNPPYLCIVQNKLDYFIRENIINQLNVDMSLSVKNTNDLIFQILITLYCVYNYKYIFSKFQLLHVFNSSPVTLIYKIGNLQFTLENVVVFPFFSIDNSTILTNLNNDIDYDKKITDSYNELVTLMFNGRYNNNMFPYIQKNTCECLLSHLLLVYSNISNICRFDIVNDKKGNKYLNEFCLKEKNIGNVYKMDNDILVFVGNKLFYNLNNGNILELDKDDMIYLYDIKEIKPLKSINQTYIFEV
jgi:hypothetical protein